MNEKLQETINRILSGAIEQASKGAESLSAQLPDIVQQLLHWKIAEAAVYSVVAGATLVTGVWATRKAYKYLKREKCMEACTMLMLPLGLATAGFFVALNNIQNILQLWLAPKVWLLEYAASLVKH